MLQSRDKKRESGGVTPGEKERVCDSCFNRLCFEALQPSPDHFSVRQLKNCANELITSLSDLVDALDDPDGDSASFQQSIRETMALTRGLDALNGSSGGSGKEKTTSGSSPQKSSSRPPSISASSSAGGVGGATDASGDETLISAIKLRRTKLSRSEDMAAKFLESAEQYHRVAKRLVEQKQSQNRLWGAS